MGEHPEIVVIGSLNADLVQNVDRLPKPGETIVGGSLETFSGGKGANQAYAAGRMGADVSMIGQLGSDGLASLLLESLRFAGVNHRVGWRLRRADRRGHHPCSARRGKRNHHRARRERHCHARGGRRETGVLREGGYLLSQLEIPIESVDKSLAVAKERGATTILDPAPARPLAPELLANVDFLTPNETETLTLLGDAGFTMDDDSAIERAAQGILALGPKTVVLKLGARGCMIATRQDSYRVPGFKVAAVDTTAAGDVFNGAFATALAEGLTVPAAARFANAAAALSVTRPGAQNSVPSREEVNQFLSEVGA